MFTTTSLAMPHRTHPADARKGRPGVTHAPRASLLGLRAASSIATDPLHVAQADILLRHVETNGEVFSDAFVHELARLASERDELAGHPVWERAARGAPWRGVARGLADASSGAAARSAPLGAHFAHDLRHAAQQAGRAARVTHTHADGVAGAVAVALASACFARDEVEPYVFWPTLLAHMPHGRVRDGVRAASGIAASLPPEHAAAVLPFGPTELAADIVPIAIWCATRHPDHFEDAMQAARSACKHPHVIAIAGSIVGARTWPPTATLTAA